MQNDQTDMCGLTDLYDQTSLGDHTDHGDQTNQSHWIDYGRGVGKIV